MVISINANLQWRFSVEMRGLTKRYAPLHLNVNSLTQKKLIYLYFIIHTTYSDDYFGKILCV